MIVRTFTLGPYETNCYIVQPEGHDGCWIVDASFEPQPLIDAVNEMKLKPEALVLTHTHVDHIAGVNEVLAAFPRLPIIVHEAEANWLEDPMLNLSAMGGTPIVAPYPDRTFKHADTLHLGPSTWRAIHTPGHSPGGAAYYHQPSGTLIAGDALFAGSIGRTDLPGGDHDMLLAAIKDRLYILPDDTRVYPGHGPPTTIGREKQTNPFVKG